MKEKRFWEIDSLRGLAIVSMVAYHFFFDIRFFTGQEVLLSGFSWRVIARVIAAAFIFLVGVSLTLSYSRARKSKTGKQLLYKHVKRGSKIFGLGLVITLVTWLFLGKGYVVFGILHFIGVAIILAFPFLRLGLFNLFLGMALLPLGTYLQGFSLDSGLLVWLGVTPTLFYTIDYFPLVPWFGVVLLGVFFGKMLYPNHVRRLKLRDLSSSRITKAFSFLGRHSLLVYLIHQPMLVGLLYLLVL